MSKLALGFIADDYTGASDLANTLAKNGLRTVQTIGVPAESLTLPDVDAVVVALKSRAAPAAQAMAWSRAADRWLREQGAPHVMFKICSTFDSTDLGNIGPVTEALQDDHDDTPVLVTPAFPETGRSVYMGHLFVGSDRLDESPLKDHPLNPMRDSSLVRTLARQSRRPVGLISLPTIEAGPDAVTARIETLRSQGIKTFIVDAVCERNLEVIGQVALSHRLSTGASGLGLGLARAVTKKGHVGSRKGTPLAQTQVGGQAAILAGSCSKATLEQIAAIEGTIPTLQLNLERLIKDPGEIDQVIAWAQDHLSKGPVLIASSSPPAAVQDLKSRHSDIGHQIEQSMAVIAEQLVASGVRRLIVAGGETSGAVVDRLNIPAFLIHQEIAPGVPVVEAVGRVGPALLMALKSGNFGGQDFFLKALSMMS
jgi:uncharacterized protein YgbK (DUF1537 family)